MLDSLSNFTIFSQICSSSNFPILIDDSSVNPVVQIKKQESFPDWCGSVGWTLSHTAKGCWLDSQSGHVPGLWTRSPVGTWEGGNQLIFLSHINVSPPFFPPPFPSLYKIFLKNQESFYWFLFFSFLIFNFSVSPASNISSLSLLFCFHCHHLYLRCPFFPSQVQASCSALFSTSASSVSPLCYWF